MLERTIDELDEFLSLEQQLFKTDQKKKTIEETIDKDLQDLIRLSDQDKR